MKLIVIAGGTGGHIFPGIAVAHYLMSHGWKVRWLGTFNNIEVELVPKHGIDIDCIHINGIRNKGINNKIKFLFKIFSSIRKAIRIIKYWKPDVVLGMGGYVSGPGGLAAWSCRIPIILHEQNCVAGFTNRLLTILASKVLQAFPCSLYQAAVNVVVGNPIRKDLLSLQEPILRLSNRIGPIRVLVMGGSKGAKVLNKIMPLVAARLSSNLKLLHQVGNGALLEVTKTYAANNCKNSNIVVEFIDDIVSAYAWADVVVCRSGAITVSEIASAGLPALFVPFIYHKDQQQYWNARYLENVGAAIIIEEYEFTVDRISKLLSILNRKKLLSMAQRARSVAITDATERVAHEVIAAVRI